MNQNDLNRAVARATGETVSTISSLGFQLDEPAGRFDSHLNDPGPEIIDWDALDPLRGLYSLSAQSTGRSACGIDAANWMSRKPIQKG